jgi:hypothetical protein
MAPLRAAVATLLLGGGLVLFTPAGPAAACSCALVSLDERLRGPGLVFRGTVVDISGPEDGSTTYTFAVEEVFKGRASATTEVRSGTACGLERIGVGNDLVVFAYRDRNHPEELFSGLCSGTARATYNLVRNVEALTGAGHAPEAAGQRTEHDEPADPFIPYWAMVALAVGAVGLLALALAWRRRA